MVERFKLACVQMLVSNNKLANLTRAKSHIQAAAKMGAHVVMLPECFNSPYDTKSFPQYAEPIPSRISELDVSLSPSIHMLSTAAKECQVHLVGGSIPETDGKHVYNTCTVYNKEGELVAKHRKVHLFDIDIPGKIRFKESDTLTAGSQLTTFKTELCTFGVGICYDLRFPEMASLLAQKAEVLLYPGAFNTTTGPKHWELLQRGRAVDNQVWVCTASPANNPESDYKAWGHSSIVNPWGEVVATTEEQEAIVVAEIDLVQVREMRQAIPVRSQRRSDLYTLSAKL